MSTKSRSLRQRQTSQAVIILLVLLIALCAGWAVFVQHAVPNACDHSPPPARAQYLHCG